MFKPAAIESAICNDAIEFVLVGKIGRKRATHTAAVDNDSVAIDQGMSAAVATWWEACSGVNGDGSVPTLAGFVTSQGAEILFKKVGDAKELHNHVMNDLVSVFGVDTKAMGFDESNKTIQQYEGVPGKDGLVVSIGGITVTYKR